MARPRFSVTFAASILLFIGSLILFMSLFYQGTSFFPKVFLTEMTTEKTKKNIDILFQEKKVLEEKINVCQEEKKNLANYLETEKEIHRKINATLKEKLYEQKKNSTANATTFDKKLFNYMATFLRDTPYPGVENYTRYTVARLGMKPLAGIEPLKPEFGPVINDVTSFRYPITIPACNNVKKTGRSVFVVVNSAPGNFDKRNIIRQTWRKHLKPEYHKDLITIFDFIFILGLPDNNVTQKQIEEESKTNGDIIQIDIPDIYRRLAVKVAGLFNWLNRNCANINFILKVDDDVYVNARNLVHFISQQDPSNQSIFGSYVAGPGDEFIVNRGGKWSISFEEWPWHRYPHYLFGPGVVISGSSVFPLLAAMQTTPIMPFDDVYYLGICTEKTDIRLHFSSKSNSVFSVGLPDLSTPCNLRRFATWQTSSGDEMKKSHTAIEDFYGNKTQCVVAGSNGTNAIINNEPVHFDFDIYFHSIS